MSFEEFIQNNGTVVSFKKAEHIFYQGDQHDALYFVQSGLLKAYYVSPEGKENIKSFIKPKNVIGSLSAAHQGVTCTFSLLALEQAELIRFPFKALLAAAHQSHAIATQLIDILLTHSMKKEQREFEFLMLPAAQRYLKFKQREPELANTLTQNARAKYLGITPVALSRIKHRGEDLE